LTGAKIAPAFDSSVILYDVAVAADAPSFTVTAAAQSRWATVAVEGKPAGNAPITFTVPPVGRRTVMIDVTAQNGTMIRYTLRVVREAAAPANEGNQNTQTNQTNSASSGTQSSTQAETTAALTMPPDAGNDRVLVTTRGLRLGAKEAADLAAAADQPGLIARITVRSYRTAAVITQYPGRVEAAARGKEMVIALNARSNGVTLPRDRMVEVELAIPTKAGKYLYYTGAQPAAGEVRIEVPFLLYGDKPAVAWPPAGTLVPVSGLLSTMPPGKERAMDKEDFPKNAKGAVTLTVTLEDAALDKPIQVPEGATVKYVLSATAKNGKAWTAAGTAQVWTTDPAYPTGFQPVILPVSDDLAPGGPK